jgi:hypothetical protein
VPGDVLDGIVTLSVPVEEAPDARAGTVRLPERSLSEASFDVSSER